MHGLDVASLVAVFVALIGAAIAVRFLPAAQRVAAAPEPVVDPEPALVTAQLQEV
jgi:hypothetical protein